jgi:DNA-directed RNA polymerase subunit F
MEIISKNCGMLTNAEVMAVVEEQREKRGKRAADPELQNQQRIEKTTLSYLRKSAIGKTSSAMCERFMGCMQKLQQEDDKYYVTEAEMLQLVNHVPVTEVELHLILEDCASRFTSDMVDRVLKLVRECYELPEEVQEEE